MTAAPAHPVTTRGRLSWAVFDVANSAYPTVIATFVFAAYFTQGIAEDPVRGTEVWGYAMSISGLMLALTAPVLGAIADHWGPRKPWIGAFTVLCVALTASLWFAEPRPEFVIYALVLVALSNYAFEAGTVFYNAMLPDLVAEDRLGRWSGWSWAMGYGGGLVCLALALVVLVQADPPPFGLDKDQAEHLRATTLLVALWFGVFCLPLFLFTPDTKRSGMGLAEASLRGLATLKHTFSHLRHYRDIAWFLLARMIYTDGLNTLFAFGGIFAAGTFGFTFEELILFAIAINVTAGLGAFGFGWLDDRLGSKPTILLALGGLCVLGGLLLVLEGKMAFWAVGVPLGLFMGPAQAASRSHMARIAPDHLRAEMFGLYAFSGKATAFMGPALVGAATAAFDSQRLGMATILIFLVAGALLLHFTVPAIKAGSKQESPP
ncbi:MAG: MFS transporter [Magnetovibrionaceae bacterium]